MLSRLLFSTGFSPVPLARALQCTRLSGLAHPSRPPGSISPLPVDDVTATQQPTPQQTASGVVLHTVFDEASQDREEHPLLQYRAAYPESIWSKIHKATPPTPNNARPVAVDIGIGTGRGAIELAKRGFRVIGVESSSNLMASTHHSAAQAGVAVDLIPATLEGQILAAQSADVVTILHGLHLVPTAAALREAHRLLRPRGVLVAAWNDRDLASPFIQQLESLMESFNASYSRHLKQRDLAHWGDALQQEGLFRLLEYSVHPNPLHLRGAAPLLDILDCLTFMRHSRRPSAERRQLHGRVLELVHKHFGKGPFDLPLETKLFLLRRDGGNEKDAAPSRDAAPSFVPPEPLPV